MTESGPALHTVTGYVLAGGQSSRMGQDKAFLQIDAEPLVEHALQRLRPFCTDVRILSGPANFERDALLSCYAHLVPDQGSAHSGPLAALAAALDDCATTYAVLHAVDQPGLSTPTLAHLAHTGIAGLAPAACFRANGAPEPLPLLVSRDLRPGILRALQTGERRLLQTVQTCAAELGSEMLLISVESPNGFANLNTPEDLLRWQNVP